MSVHTGFMESGYSINDIENRQDLLATPQRATSGRCRNPLAVPEPENTTPGCLAVPMDRIFHRSSGQWPERVHVICLSHAVARAVFEIIAGYRAVGQLNFVMRPDCISKLRNQALIETDGYKLNPEPGTSHGQVRSLRLRKTVGGCWECTVILGFKYRVRAVALRIEPWHGRWQVVSVEML